MCPHEETQIVHFWLEMPSTKKTFSLTALSKINAEPNNLQGNGRNP